jgi:hypothetical protein
MCPKEDSQRARGGDFFFTPDRTPLTLLTTQWVTAARDGQHQQRRPTSFPTDPRGYQRVGNGRQRRPAPTATPYILRYRSWGSPKGWGAAARDGQHQQRPPKSSSTGIGGHQRVGNGRQRRPAPTATATSSPTGIGGHLSPR